ncbi:MAG: MFS transporter [Hyphomicrobiales bacterium]|nr:MFS transporter [Hyphomicrobiales bacterium]
MTETKLTRASLAVLIVGFLVLFVGGGSRFAIGLVLKPMAEELDWTRGALGATAGIFLVVSAVCMFVSGRLSDRFSLRSVLCGGLLISALGIGSMSYVSTPWQALLFYGIVFAVGNGLASIAPVGVMISRWFADRIGLANATTTSGIGIGQLFIIAGLATALSDIGWRSAFVWLAIANLVLLPVVFANLGRSQAGAFARTAPRTDSGTTLREAMRTRQFWLLLLAYAICGFQDFFVATHIVAFAQDHDVDTLLAGYMLAAMGLTGVIGVMLAGAWSDRHGPKRATVFCFLLRIAIFGLILFDQSTVSVATFALLYGITFWLTAPLTVVFTRNAFGAAHLGAISGLIVMVHHMCGGLGAYVGAAIFDAQGNYDLVFVLMFALSVAAAAASARLR